MASYTIDELNSKSIFEIRAIAKEVGVSAPTKINKAELVDLIFRITNGKMDPPTAPRRGRPKKDIGGRFEDDEQTVGTNKSAKNKGLELNIQRVDNVKVDPNDKESFSSSRRVAEPKNEEAEQIREGYLEINPDGYGFLRVKNGEFNEMDAYVASVKIKQYDLRRGDFVKAAC
ncbi:MAG: hypothetical protein J5815_03635, partial [Clostridia bacterium]|nr:hypothetical protein [Clostridia bacterium]